MDHRPTANQLGAATQGRCLLIAVDIIFVERTLAGDDLAYHYLPASFHRDVTTMASGHGLATAWPRPALHREYPPSGRRYRLRGSSWQVYTSRDQQTHPNANTSVVLSFTTTTVQQLYSINITINTTWKVGTHESTLR